MKGMNGFFAEHNRFSGLFGFDGRGLSKNRNIWWCAKYRKFMS